MMELDFRGKVALVTGGTRGLGSELADSLERAGAEVITTGTDPHFVESANKLAREKSASRTYICSDFSDRNALLLFCDYLRSLPRLDICINNAGVNRPSSIDEVSIEDWDYVSSINITAPLCIIKAVASTMKAKRAGRILNVGSVFGEISAKNRAAYCTSKAALKGLTKAAALDLAPFNVLVNSIAPGFIDTDLLRSHRTPEQILALEKSLPSKKLLLKNDVCPFLLYLVSDLNTYLTGQTILIDGGFSIV